MLFDLTDGRMTPFELMVLTSHENAHKIISKYLDLYYKGQIPFDNAEDVLDDICDELNIHEGDLLQEDIEKVRDTIMDLWED